MKVSINRFAFAALLCCGMFLLSSNVRAQPSCPDNTGPAPDPATCPWISMSITYTYPGTSCNVTVYYCYRSCSGNDQVYVTEVDPDMSTDCDGIDPGTMLYLARDAALQDALPHLPNIPPCAKGTNTVVTTYMPACWMAVQNPSTHNTEWVNCSAWGCSCQRTCTVCYQGTPTPYSISCTNSGAPSCDCYASDPSIPSTGWQFSSCYRLLCE